MASSKNVQYLNNKIIIKELPEGGEDLQVFVRPSDKIVLPKDMADATYHIVGGDILLKLPSGATITFVSLGLIAFTDNTVTMSSPAGVMNIDDILSQIDDVKESPIESVVTDSFVKLNEEYTDAKDEEVAPENQNFSQILQEPATQVDTQKKKFDEDDIAKPADEAEVNDFDAVYKPTDDNPVNIAISEVNNAVEAGLKFTLTAFQTAKLDTVDVNGEVVEVAGGGGSAYGAVVDTPEAQFQSETLDYSKKADGVTNNTDAITIYADSPKLFKTDPTDITSESQLARDLSIRPEQPTGFGISKITISNLPNGFKIVGATLSNGTWEVPEATYDAQGNLLTDGFTVDINTGKARFTMTYPDDLPEGDEVTAVINFDSTFSQSNLLPGENVDTPDVTLLSGQGRLYFVTKEIDWDSPTGYEGFIDPDERVVLATNPNNNFITTSHGDSVVVGGDGKDAVVGLEGNDTFYGNKGDDVLDGGLGDDTIDGGDGDDTLIGQAGVNILDGGDGLDTVDYTYVTDNGGVTVDLSANSGTSAGVTDTLSNIERVVGSSNSDVITGDGLNNILEGASGVDTLDGGAGLDTLLGGNEADTLDGGAGDDILYGGTGDDSLVGGVDNDTLFGEAGDDTLFFDAGNDTLDGGLGSDTMDFSTFVGGVNASIYEGDVTIANNTGTDTITNMEILSGSADADQLSGGSDDNTLLGQGGADILRGNEGNDILDGGEGDDTLKGGADIDSLIGGEGDDLLFGEAGADKIDGGIGIDTASYADEGAIRTTLNEGTFTAVNVSGGDSDQIKNVENIQGSNTGNDSIKGDGLTNVLDGQGGHDTIDGAGGDDTILGGDGNDMLSGGAGLDLIDGGGHDAGFGDTVDYTNEGRVNVDLLNSGDTSVEINGSAEDTLRNIENIIGSQAYDDTITGNNQKNILSGLAGADTLSGEEGDDTIYGGDGDDTLFGNDGKDDLFGGAGDDTLNGGAGSDNLDGGTGIDFVSYATATTRMNIQLDIGTASGEGAIDGIVNVENIQGSDFEDTIIGNDSVNVLAGGLSNDTIAGGLGDDTLLGEGGADTLRGGEGSDKLYGEDDIGTADSSTQDMASYSDVDNITRTGITVNMTNDNTATAIVENDGYGNEDFLYDIENIQGTDYRDFITGDTGDNYLLGEGDNDTLVGGLGNDTLDGGANDDTLSGSGGDDTLLGGTGLDTADYTNAAAAIKVDLGNGLVFNVTDDGDSGKDSLVDVENIIGSDIAGQSDTIIGDTANNLVFGLDGDDTLKGGSGLDTLDGGIGNDTLFGGADSDTLIGGAGDHDIVDFSDVTANGVKVDLQAGTATGDGNDILETIEDIRGSDFVDTLSGSNTLNTIYGGAGDDILEGGEKALSSTDTDTLYGEDGDDTLRGDAGDDALFGGDGTTDTGSDTADYSTVTNGTNTGIDADLTRGTPQVIEDGYGTQDTLTGIENISGTQYNDLIKGSDDVAESNILSGNEGDDSFIASDGSDSIIGGDDKDTIDYNSITNAGNTGIVMDFDSIVVEKSITKTTATGTYIDKVQSVERIIATEYADDIKGDAGENEYFGMSGDDTILGNTGDDTLYGDDLANTLTSDDLLDGGDGDDELHGGKGDDTLIGGRGDDLIDGGDDFDIVNYTSSQAKISLSSNTVSGADTGTDTLQNIELIQATLYGDTLVGGAGKDVIDGRGGADTMLGKAGDDTLYGYTGSDTINGGLGNDVLIGGSDADLDTVGFNEILVGGTVVEDLNSIVMVNLESDTGASVISLNQSAAIVDGTVYSFDVNILDAAGAVVSTTTATHTAAAGETGDDIIAALYLQVNAITGINALADESNSPNNDVDFNSHRILLMDNSTANGFSITGIDTSILATEQAGVATSVNTDTGATDKDFIFDFDNITGTDILLDASNTRVGDTLEGNSGNNSINAGAGDDTIMVTLGTDILDGQADNDWVDYSKQSLGAVVTLDDGLGEGSDNFGDTLKNIENIRGTSASDTITGDANNNIIEGGANDTISNETLSGDGGDDTIYGQAGVDLLYGGTGNDTLYGGDDNDRLSGGDDADKYDGGAGYDIVDYYFDSIDTSILLDMSNMARTDANGDDSTTTFTDIEAIYGSNVDDEITVTGDINIASRIGNDILIGGSGVNVISAGDGNDLIDGGAGEDILLGGRDNDTFYASSGVDSIDGGADLDTIDFRDDRTYLSSDTTTQTIGTNVTQGINIDLTNQVINDNGFGESGTVIAIERVEATRFDDIYRGDVTYDVANLYGGDDTAYLSTGTDVLDGGDNSALGGDWLDASFITTGANFYLNDGVGYVYMAGSQTTVKNFEHVKGSAQNDFIYGTSFDNTLLGMAGDDTFVGTSGDDYFDGGDNNDIVTYSYSGDNAPSNVVVHYDTAVKTVSGGYGGTDTLVSIETVFGTTSNDTFFGSTSGDTFLSGGGQDIFNSSEGDDYFSGNEGGVTASIVDYSNVTAGNKLILDMDAVADQAQVVATADGAKYFTDQLQNMKNIIATNESDTLTGNTENNSMYGLEGNDTFFATDGNDIYDGGASVDGDWVDYSSASTIIISDLDIGSTSKGINNSSDIFVSIEHIQTGSADDSITASIGDNTIIANAGSDTIYSNDGNNVFFGDDATDTTTNDGTRDTIRYDVEDTGSGVKVNISDADVLGITANSATNAYGGTDILYNFEQIRGSANGDTLVGNAIYNSINGGAGADTIVGGSSGDRLKGSGGDDTFIFLNSEFGSDNLVSGGDDIDTLEITDQAAITDADFEKIDTAENILLSSDNAHSVTLGANADITGIVSIDATAALTSNVSIDISAMSNDMTIKTSTVNDSVKLGSGTDIVNTYDGADTIEYDAASKVDNAVGQPSDTIDAGAGTDTLFANSGEDYDFTSATISSVESVKFFEGTNDQTIEITSEQNLEINNFEGGNSGQVNSIHVVTTATQSDIDLTIGKTFGTNIDSTIIDAIYTAGGILTGNAATKDTITGNSGVDTLSGLGGDDILNAGAGADLILDGAGVDTIDAGAGDDRVEFSVANLDASNGADTVKGGADTDTLAITDAVTTANLTDTQLTNVSEFETISFSDVVNDITLNQDGVELLGGSDVDTFNYAGADLSSADTIDGAGGIDELKFTSAATKVLGDFANVSNVELLTTSDSDDNIDLSGGDNGFETITMGQGDDTLTIDSHKDWSGKTLDGGELGETNGDTLTVAGTLAVDLSQTTVINFENIASGNDLSLTVKQINDLGNINVGTHTLSVVGNDGDTSMSATNITAGTLKFTSGMENPTTVSDVHMNVDASGSNQSITIGVNAATDKTSIEIKGSSGGADVLNVSLNTDESLTTGFKVDNQVETFNLSVDGNSALDLTNVDTTTTLKTTGSTGTTTIDNAGKNIDASNLASTETLVVNATATTIDITGGASASDAITIDTTTDNFGTISGIEIINIEENNSLISGKINTDVTNINITNGKTLALSATDLDANTLVIDDGTTNFTAGAVGDNNYSGISLTSSAELVMQVNTDLNIASQGSDNIAVVTEVDIANDTIFTLNADQTNSDLDVLGSNAGSSLVIKSTSTDLNNDFSGITKNGANSGTITYSVINVVDKSGEDVGILGEIDTLEILSPNTLKTDSPQLVNVTTLNGAGTLDVVGDGAVDLSTLDGNFSGEILISDVAGTETIIASKFDDIITIDAGTGDSIVSGAGDDTINLSQNVASIDGGADTDEIVLKVDGLDLAPTTITGIEKISFDVAGASSVTMKSTDVNTIAIAGDASTNTIKISDTGNIDLSSASLASIEEIMFNDSAVNTITADLNDINLLLGDSGDTLKIATGSFTSADTITGGTGVDTIEFTNGGTVADAAFSNVTLVEVVKFSNSATDVTFGTQAGNIVTVTGGSSTSDALTLNTGGSYDNISAIETLNVDKTIDLSGKITDVTTINVLSANGDLTLDADDFVAAIGIDNDKILTINDATTSTISNVNFTGSTGETIINLNAGGTTIDFSSVVFDGNVSLVGSSGADVMSVDEGVKLFDGSSGTDELIIKAGSSDSFGSSSIINFETITVNESVNLSGAIDDDIVTDIDVATGKTLTLDAADLSGKTIDFGGAGDTTVSAGVVDANDYYNISVSGTGNLTLAVSTALDISGSGSDDITAFTQVTMGSGDTFTIDASQSNNTLTVVGNNANSDFIIEAASVDANNDFTNFVNSGNGNIILDVVENVDKSGEAASILGDIDSINLSDTTKAITLDSNQISNLTTLDGTGTLNVNAVGGVADLSGLTNGSFTGTINIITDSTQVDTITGSNFNDNIVYSGDAQADTLNGGTGTDTILINNDADLTALAGANVTNITKMDVSGNYTATIDKDFAENSSVTTYTGTGTGGGATTDFIKVALGDGEDINLTSQTFADLTVKIDVASGGGNSSIVANDEVNNIITLADGTNDITLFGADDTVTGGSDTDTIKIQTASLNASDHLDGGAGVNTLEFTSGTGGIDDTKFTNVTNITILKTADADTTIDFSNDAGSITTVDASNMTTSTSNLDLTTGSALNDVTAGSNDDIIRYADTNLSSSDNVDGSGGIDRLIISDVDSDGVTIAASALSNISNLEVLELSDSTNTVDLTSSSIDSIEGGSGTDSITAQGDELSIKTNAGDDTVYISSVPSGLIDGGANDIDTLDVTGELDLSTANIINFEKIVTSDNITLNIAQANNVTLAIASGKTLTIKDSSGTGTLNAANITGGAINIASLTAALIITGLATQLDASATSQDLTINSVDGSKDVIGSSGTTTVEYATNTTLTGNLSAVDTIIADNGLTVDATLLDGKTQEFSTTDTITINATTTAADHDFSNITQVDAGNVLLNVDGSVDLTAQDISVIDTFDVANSQTLTLSASQLSGKTAIGSGTIELTDTTLTASELNGFDTNSTALIDAASVTSISGSSSDLDTMYNSSGIATPGSETISFDDTATIATANTVDGATTGVITATVETESATNLATLTGTGNAYTITTSGTDASAVELNTINAATTVAMTATSIATITSSAFSDVNTMITNAADIGLDTNWTVTLSDTTVAVADANTVSDATTGAVSATISEGDVATLGTLSDTNNAYTITITDTSATAIELNTVDNVTTVDVDASAITAIESSAVADVKTMITNKISVGIDGNWTVTLSDSTVSVSDANTVSDATTEVVTATISEGDVATLVTLTDTNNAYTITLTDTNASATDLNTIDAKTSVNVDASAITDVTSSAMSDVLTMVANATTVGIDTNWNVVVSDTTVSAADAKTVNGGTSGTIDISSSTTLDGSTADVLEIVNNTGAAFITASDYASTLSDTASATDANTVANDTTGIVTATVTGDSAAQLNTDLANADSNDALTLTVTGTSAVSSDLVALDGKTSVAVDAVTNINTITGTAADARTVVESAGIDTATDVDVTIDSGNATVTQANDIDAQTTGEVTATITEGDVATLTTLTGTHAYTITLTDTNASATDLNTIDAKTSVNVDASAITDVTSSAMSDVLTMVANATTVGIDTNWNVAVSDTTVSAADAKTVNGGTSGTIDISASTTLDGSTADVLEIVNNTGAAFTTATDYASTLSDTASATDANTVANDTTGIVTATVTGDSAAQLNTDLANADSNDAFTLTTTGTSANATDITGLDGKTSEVVDATSITTITGTEAETKAAVAADVNGGVNLSDVMVKLDVTDDNNDMSGVDWSTISTIDELDFSGVGTHGIDQNLLNAFDSISGSGGTDTLTGSAGNDTFSFIGKTLTSIEETAMLGGDDSVTLDFSQIASFGILDGGADTDTVDIASGIDVSGSSQSITDGAFASIENIDISGAIVDGANTFDITQSNIDSWTDGAGSGNISITISSADNTNNNIKLTGDTDDDGAGGNAPVTDRTSFVDGATYTWDADTSITFTIV